MTLARRLHDLRLEHALSLQEVASAIGASRAYIWNLEKGRADNPSLEMIGKLAGLFRVRIADLVGENPAAADEDPEMVAMFRDLKQLDTRDRETIRVLMQQLKQRQQGKDKAD